MCTVTLIPLPGAGVRLVTNRDESRRRAPGLPPVVREVAPSLHAAYPIDGEAGGSWVAVSDRGVLLAILNANLTPAPPLVPPKDRLSRGLVIPELVDAEDANAAAERVEDLALPRMAPFRLLIADARLVRLASWNGEKLARARYPLGPMCFASSGLGDERVAPRLTLFEQWMDRHGPTPQSQDAFHQHVWPDRPEISVMMSREDARTVSVTAVELRPGPTGLRASMTYRDDAGERQVNISGPRPAAAGRA